MKLTRILSILYFKRICYRNVFAGYFSVEFGKSTASYSLCPLGTYSDSGAETCTLCPGGTYSVAGVCLNCPAGTFAPLGSSTCSPCAAGTYSANGWQSCALCPSGTYSPVGYSLATCIPCPANTYTSGSAMCAMQSKGNRVF